MNEGKFILRPLYWQNF